MKRPGVAGQVMAITCLHVLDLLAAEGYSVSIRPGRPGYSDTIYRSMHRRSEEREGEMAADIEGTANV